MAGSDITYIGITNYRNTKNKFGIKDADRLGHLYILGKTGVGKSTLIMNMVLSDIHRGNGCMLIDPHGDIAKRILQDIPKWRETDLIYMNAKDTSHAVSFNPLQNIAPKYHHLVASGLISSFRKIWADSWGVRLEYILKNALLTLLWFPSATLLDIQPLLTDSEFRTKVLQHVDDDYVLAFWRNEFDRYTPRLRIEAISPILNKVGVFTSSLPLRSIVGSTTNKAVKISQVMDSGKILLVNLSKGEVGEDASVLLGCMLISAVQLAATYRASQAEETRRPFYLYVDECHSFVTEAIATIFAEARKYKLSLCLANQYLEQLSDPIRSAIFGNIGTLIAFRVGASDAVFLSQEFTPEFTAMDLLNLPKYSIYLKLMIDGATSQPFSARTILFDD